MFILYKDLDYYTLMTETLLLKNKKVNMIYYMNVLYDFDIGDETNLFHNKIKEFNKLIALRLDRSFQKDLDVDNMCYYEKEHLNIKNIFRIIKMQSNHIGEDGINWDFKKYISDISFTRFFIYYKDIDNVVNQNEIIHVLSLKRDIKYFGLKINIFH